MPVGQLLRLGVGGAGGAGAAYSDKVLSYSPIAYWPLWEASGSAAECLVDSAQNGTYTGVTLGQTGIGDGKTCPLFDGLNDYCDIYSATFAAAFDDAEGTCLIWAKVFNVGVWTDATWRSSLSVQTDYNNKISKAKTSVSNTLDMGHRRGGASYRNAAAGRNSTDWYCWAITWSMLADELKTFENGSQWGATFTSLNAWAGALPNTGCAIGALSTAPSDIWHGWLAHCAIWDQPLTPTQVADLAVV